MKLIQLLPAIVFAFALTLGAAPHDAEAGLCKKLGFSKKCVVRGDIKKDAINSSRVKDESLISADIKDESLTSADINNESLTGSDVQDGSLTADDLATNSVTAAEIAAGAVGSAEVLDGSLSESDMLDEGGADFIEEHQTFTLSPGFQTVRQVTVSAPTSGLVVVTASGTFEFAETSSTDIDQVSCAVTTGGTGSNVEQFLAGEADTAQEIMWVPFSSIRGFVVDQGDTIFKLNCSPDPSSTVKVLNSMMTAMFFPTRY